MAMLLLSTAALTGCATPAWWKHTAARDWGPDSSTAQFLATTTAGEQSVVVVFQQSLIDPKKTKSRVVAWNVRRPSSELAIGRGAVRQLTNACDRVQAMPCFPHDGAPADATSASPGHTIYGPLTDQFTVHLNGAPVGPFQLPFSREPPRLGLRLAILPFAVAADAAIVAGVCAAGAGAAAGNSGGFGGIGSIGL